MRLLKNRKEIAVFSNTEIYHIAAEEFWFLENQATHLYEA